MVRGVHQKHNQANLPVQKLLQVDMRGTPYNRTFKNICYTKIIQYNKNIIYLTLNKNSLNDIHCVTNTFKVSFFKYLIEYTEIYYINNPH